ncbi:MAG: DNA-binding protein [Eubacterium sp.]|nr:DNA-binding protein [Eubacterium sp.]
MEKLFLSAEEVAEVMGISTAYAYKVIQRMNKELKKKGFITMQGRIDRKFFYDQFYGTADVVSKEVR